MYHDFLGREIEDLEGENMRRDAEEDRKANALLDTVFSKLLEIYLQVKEPGKSALVIFPSGEDIASFVEKIGGPDVFKQALADLTERKRIHARKMEYPADIPEAYEITFSAEEERAARASLKLHWLNVGYVSPDVKKTIEEQGGRVDEMSHEPRFFAVGLPYDPAGYWSWSKGRRQHRDPLEFWTSYEHGPEIQMEHLTLQWGPRNVEFQSVEDTYLIQPWEEFDKETGKVKEPEENTSLVSSSSGPAGDDFDPFLDTNDLP